jgi:hypothetical protein
MRTVKSPALLTWRRRGWTYNPMQETQGNNHQLASRTEEKLLLLAAGSLALAAAAHRTGGEGRQVGKVTTHRELEGRAKLQGCLRDPRRSNLLFGRPRVLCGGGGRRGGEGTWVTGRKRARAGACKAGAGGVKSCPAEAPGRQGPPTRWCRLALSSVSHTARTWRVSTLIAPVGGDPEQRGPTRSLVAGLKGVCGRCN